MAEPTSTYMFFRLLKCSFAHNVTFLYYITIATFQEQQHTCNPNIQPQHTYNPNSNVSRTQKEHKQTTGITATPPKHHRQTTQTCRNTTETPPRHHRQTTETPSRDHTANTPGHPAQAGSRDPNGAHPPLELATPCYHHWVKKKNAPKEPKVT